MTAQTHKTIVSSLTPSSHWVLGLRNKLRLWTMATACLGTTLYGSTIDNRAEAVSGIDDSIAIDQIAQWKKYSSNSTVKDFQHEKKVKVDANVSHDKLFELLNNVPTLTHLDLSGCQLIGASVEGNRHQLKRLTLNGYDRLNVLILSQCPQLYEVILMNTKSLKRLYLDGCNELRLVDFGTAPKLQVLSLRGCAKLDSVQATPHSEKQKWTVQDAPTLQRISSFKYLELLDLRGTSYPTINYVENLVGLAEGMTASHKADLHLWLKNPNKKLESVLHRHYSTEPTEPTKPKLHITP